MCVSVCVCVCVCVRALNRNRADAERERGVCMCWESKTSRSCGSTGKSLRLNKGWALFLGKNSRLRGLQCC